MVKKDSDATQILKDKLGEFMVSNPNLVEEMAKELDNYGTVAKWDTLGRITYMKDINGNVREWEYGKFGIVHHIDTARNYEERFTFDEKGHLIHEENSTGYSMDYEYDEQGHRIKEHNNQTGVTVLYEYDNQDRIVYKQINDNIATAYIYINSYVVVEYQYNKKTNKIEVVYRESFASVKEYKVDTKGKQVWEEDGEIIHTIPANKVKKEQ